MMQANKESGREPLEAGSAASGRCRVRSGPFSGESLPDLPLALPAAFFPHFPFSVMWSSPDVIGLFSINVVSFSRNAVLSALSFSINVVRN
jgi:hypothetical protein